MNAIMQAKAKGLGLSILLGWCIACHAGVIYVDHAATGANTGSSYADAYVSLQDALAAAAVAEKPVEVRVAQGVYKPDQGAAVTPGDVTATFQLLNGVTLKGGYAGGLASDPNARDVESYPTTLTGDLAGNDDSNDTSVCENSSHVVTGSGTDVSAVIDGFTITGGSKCLRNLPGGLSFAGAGGMLIDAGSPTILNCCFKGNYGAISRGVALATHGSNPVLTNCTFLANDSTGMSCLDNSSAVLTGCRFEGNLWGGVEISSSSPTITDCTFVGNGWYAIRASDSNSVLTDCVFTGGGSGTTEQGIECGDGHLTLTGCTFTGFGAGAIQTSWGDLTLVRCTFRGNGQSVVGAVECMGSGVLTALECIFTGNDGVMVGAISGGDDMQLHDCEFTGNSGNKAGAIESESGVFTVTGCLFSGNSAKVGGAGAIGGSAEVALLSNCTFVGNRGRVSTLELGSSTALPAKLTQCIVLGGPNAFPSASFRGPQVNITYSNIQGGRQGQGNIDVEPCFVDPGYWDPNGTPNDANDDFWVAGDYHLKSQGGHWDRATETWVRDNVTSLCIDAGDPINPLGVEPFPNGGVINLGAYGGSTEASKSYFGEPVCEAQMPGDINGDCKVDQTDMDILLAHWLMEAPGLVNTPPTVTLLSPQDGDELTYPTPIILQSIASDPDGTVIRIRYTLEHRVGNGRSTNGITVADPSNNWDQEVRWNVQDDVTYTVWAEAMDNEGARTASPKITITVHPAR